MKTNAKQKAGVYGENFRQASLIKTVMSQKFHRYLSTEVYQGWVDG